MQGTCAAASFDANPMGPWMRDLIATFGQSARNDKGFAAPRQQGGHAMGLQTQSAEVLPETPTMQVIPARRPQRIDRKPEAAPYPGKCSPPGSRSTIPPPPGLTPLPRAFTPPSPSRGALDGLDDFEAFGFVPGEPVLWLSRLQTARASRLGRPLTSTLSLFALEKNTAARDSARRLAAQLPGHVSWFSSGLTFSADASRVAFVPALAHAHQERVAAIASLREPQGSTTLVLTLPLGTGHGPIRLSPDGALCVLERDTTHELWDVSGFGALRFCLTQTREARQEFVLFANRQFAVVQRDGNKGITHLTQYELGKDGAANQWFTTDKLGCEWLVRAWRTPGKFTLFDAINERLCVVDFSKDPLSHADMFCLPQALRAEFAPTVSPYGRFLVSQADDLDQHLTIWGYSDKLQQWGMLATLHGRAKHWHQAIFSPEETLLALLFEQRDKHVARGSGVCLVDLTRYPLQLQFSLYAQPIITAQFAADERHMAVMINTGRAILRDRKAHSLHVVPIKARELVVHCELSAEDKPALSAQQAVVAATS